MPLLIPKIKKTSNLIYSFQDWYDIYKSEVDSIIDQYINVVLTNMSSDTVYYSLDVNKFKDKMQLLIYEKSCNREKRKIMYL